MLTDLYLEDNQITTIETGAFDSLTALQYLRISNNPITYLDSNIFAAMPSLGEVYMSNTLVSVLPESVIELPSFVDFQADNTCITPSTVSPALQAFLTLLW